MISIYQEPQISFKAFSSNLFSSSFFFFPHCESTKKPTTLKALSQKVDKIARSHFSERPLCQQG